LRDGLTGANALGWIIKSPGGGSVSMVTRANYCLTLCLHFVIFTPIKFTIVGLSDIRCTRRGCHAVVTAATIQLNFQQYNVRRSSIYRNERLRGVREDHNSYSRAPVQLADDGAKEGAVVTRKRSNAPRDVQHENNIARRQTGRVASRSRQSGRASAPERSVAVRAVGGAVAR